MWRSILEHQERTSTALVYWAIWATAMATRAAEVVVCGRDYSKEDQGRVEEEERTHVCGHGGAVLVHGRQRVHTVRHQR